MSRANQQLRQQKMHFVWESVYLARKYLLETLFLPLQLETGAPFYQFIRATRRFSLAACSAREYLHFSVILRPWAIEPATSPSTFKRATNWANPAAVK